MATLTAASSGPATSGTQLKPASSNSNVTSTASMASGLAAQYAKNGLGTNGQPLPGTPPVTNPMASSTSNQGTSPSSAAVAPGTAAPNPTDASGASGSVVPAAPVSNLESYVSNVHTAATDLVQGDYYKQYQTQQDLIARGVLPAGTAVLPATYDEYLKNQQKPAQEAIDYQTKQNAISKTLDQNSLATQNAQGKAAIAGVTAQFAQNREGPLGSSAPLVAKGFSKETQQVLSDANLRVQSAQNQRDQAMQSLVEAQKAGDENLVKVYQGQIASAEQNIRQSKIDLADANDKATQNSLDLITKLGSSGILNGATPDQIAQYAQQYGIDPAQLGAVAKASQAAQATDNQKVQQANLAAAVDTFTKLSTNGVTISDGLIQQTSEATGIAPDRLKGAAAQFNQNSAQIQSDNSLNSQQKQAALNKLNLDYSDQVKGLTTEAAKNSQHLLDLINGGYPPDVIAAFKKSAFGSEDYSDPMTQARLQYQLAQTDDARQKTYIDAVNNGLDPGAVISNSPKGDYKTVIDPTTGKYTIQGADDGSKGGQCGHFTNQVLGTTMGDGYDKGPNNKLSFADPSVGFGQGQTPPTPGMGFVMPITGSTNGHTGIFLGVDGSKPGMALVKDSNWPYHNADGSISHEVIQTHDIPLSQITGYVNPTSATVTSGSGITGLTSQQILQNADAQGIDTGKTIEDKNKYVAAIKMQGFLPGQSQQDNAPKVTPTYAQYGLLSNTDFNPGNDGDKYAAQYLDNYIKNGAFPTARGLGISTAKGSKIQLSDVADRANKLYFDATGQSLPDVQILANNKTLLTGNNKLQNNLDIQEGTIGKNFKLAIDNMDKAGVNQSAQPINAFIDSIKASMGDPSVSAYLSQNTTLANEVGSLLALKNAGGTTVADKLEASGLIPKNASEDQQKAILKILLAEAENASATIQETNGQLYQKIDPLERLQENPNRQKAQLMNSPASDYSSHYQKMQLTQQQEADLSASY